MRGTRSRTGCRGPVPGGPEGLCKVTLLRGSPSAPLSLPRALPAASCARGTRFQPRFSVVPLSTPSQASVSIIILLQSQPGARDDGTSVVFPYLS